MNLILQYTKNVSKKKLRHVFYTIFCLLTHNLKKAVPKHRFPFLCNYMVIRQKRRMNSAAITVTAMSFFLYLPVHRVIRV